MYYVCETQLILLRYESLTGARTDGDGAKDENDDR